MENQILKAKYVASFLGSDPGKALFVGLYSVNGSRPITSEEFLEIPEVKVLKAHGMKGLEDDHRESFQFFDLRLIEFYTQWKGKLVVDWPPPERSWSRWANNNRFPIRIIHEDSRLDSQMPSWDKIVLKWEELDVMPQSWRAVLSEWRGIYYIFDSSDRRGYVGSAYGRSNLLGRWKSYASSGHGGNSLLRDRDAKHFRFSVLQRVSPDEDEKDVIALENTWKDRLHTRKPYGLNDN